MRNKLLFALAIAGVLAGLVAAFILGEKHQPAPPLFKPTPNPYAAGIYANGIIESSQSNGQNLNIYPELSATVHKVLIKEGDRVKSGEPLIELDDSVQRANTEQLKLQAEAAGAALDALRAQPRKEQLLVAQAQWDQALANLRTVEAQYRKIAKSHDADAGSVSKDALDTAENQFKAAQAAATLAQRQFELTKAGAWPYDVRTQERQFQSLTQSYEAAKALLAKYTLRAPMDGVVMAVNASSGSLLTTQGVYATYTGGQTPVIVMSSNQGELAVRCYVDEILIHRLPANQAIHAQMSVRGTDVHIPLQFDRIQPYVTPKLELSDQRQERVDLRVLPIVFHFKPPAGIQLFPGQLVDVYIEQEVASTGKKPSASSSEPVSAPASGNTP